MAGVPALYEHRIRGTWGRIGVTMLFADPGASAGAVQMRGINVLARAFGVACRQKTSSPCAEQRIVRIAQISIRIHCTAYCQSEGRASGRVPCHSPTLTGNGSAVVRLAQYVSVSMSASDNVSCITQWNSSTTRLRS